MPKCNDTKEEHEEEKKEEKKEEKEAEETKRLQESDAPREVDKTE